MSLGSKLCLHVLHVPSVFFSFQSLICINFFFFFQIIGLMGYLLYSNTEQENGTKIKTNKKQLCSMFVSEMWDIDRFVVIREVK